MKRWEYLFVVPTGQEISPDDMNAYGAEGWELVQVLVPTSAYGLGVPGGLGARTVWLFKRRLLK